jgi:hypothetical protein
LQNVYFGINEANWPVTRNSSVVQDGVIYLPVVGGTMIIKAFSANRRFRSFTVTWTYIIYVPTPGKWWDAITKTLRVSQQLLSLCGLVQSLSRCSHALLCLLHLSHYRGCLHGFTLQWCCVMCFYSPLAALTLQQEFVNVAPLHCGYCVAELWLAKLLLSRCDRRQLSASCSGWLLFHSC